MTLRSICLLLCAWLLLPAASTPAESVNNPCLSDSQSQACCRFKGGTWAVGGSGGFCYTNLRKGPTAKAGKPRKPSGVGAAGIAVSDPGSEGSKPTKSKKN